MFVPKKPGKKEKKVVLGINVSTRMNETLAKLAKECSISRQSLVEQMLEHCLADVERQMGMTHTRRGFEAENRI